VRIVVWESQFSLNDSCNTPIEVPKVFVPSLETEKEAHRSPPRKFEIIARLSKIVKGKSKEKPPSGETRSANWLEGRASLGGRGGFLGSLISGNIRPTRRRLGTDSLKAIDFLLHVEENPLASAECGVLRASLIAPFISRGAHAELRKHIGLVAVSPTLTKSSEITPRGSLAICL